MDGIAPTRLDALDPAHCARIDYNLCAPPLFTPSKDTRFKRQILQFATRGAEQVAGGLSSAAAAIRGAGARLGAAARVRAAARASRPREGAAPGPGLGASLV